MCRQTLAYVGTCKASIIAACQPSQPAKLCVFKNGLHVAEAEDTCLFMVDSFGLSVWSMSVGGNVVSSYKLCTYHACLK